MPPEFESSIEFCDNWQVDEINKVVTEELTPTLERLRKERSYFMQWSANNTEIERLTRFCTACASWLCKFLELGGTGPHTGLICLCSHSVT